MTTVEFRKNCTEIVRVGVEEFRGLRLINIRVWFTADDGTMRPGKQGIALRLEAAPELLRAIQAALSAGCDPGEAPTHPAAGRA